MKLNELIARGMLTVILTSLMFPAFVLADIYDPSTDPTLLAWFKADTGVVEVDVPDPNFPEITLATVVSVWEDQSSNGFDASPVLIDPNLNAPLLSTIVAPNGLTVSVIDFSGSNQDTLILNDDATMESSDLAVFGVVYSNGTEVFPQDAFYANRLGLDEADCPTQQGYYIGWQQQNNANGKRPFHGWGAKTAAGTACAPFTHVQAPANTPGLQPNTLALINGSLSSIGRRNLNWNGRLQVGKRAADRVISYIADPGLKTSSIGGTPSVGGFGLNGGIAELMVFNTVDDVHRIKVENYLLSKYIVTSCGDYGTAYLAADTDQDCDVDIDDVKELAEDWLKCTDPADINCDQYWR